MKMVGLAKPRPTLQNTFPSSPLYVSFSHMSHEDSPAKPILVTPTAGKRGMTELHYAAYCNDLDAVLEHLSSGTPVDVRDDNGWTPLHCSIDMSQAWGEPNRVVSTLLEHGASANSADNFGFTVLMMACGRSNLNILGQLLKAGADVHARSVDSSPLHEAAGSNFHESIATLLALGADPTIANGRGWTPEQLAEKCGFDKAGYALQASKPST